jgi:hypothetical protein
MFIWKIKSVGGRKMMMELEACHGLCVVKEHISAGEKERKEKKKKTSTIFTRMAD